MKRAAQWWMVAQIAGLCLAVAATVASADDVRVTDAERTYVNFVQETATVNQGEIRLELRGILEEDQDNTHLNLLGLPVKNVHSLSGGIIDLVGSYGLAKNVEVGLIIPSYIQSLQLESGGNKVNNSDIGDVLLYGKLQRRIAEDWMAGAGLQLTMPNGPVDKGFGYGKVGVTPILSTRWQQGRFGVGANVGWTFYNGNPPDTLNYGAEVFVRANQYLALRTEIAGRVFDQDGRTNNLQVLPGVDFKWSDLITVRPTGMIGATNAALDWGIGVGIAVAFAAPTLEMPTAPPPPAPAAEPPPPPPVKEKIVLRGVHFDFNKATIRPEDMPILDQAAETLKEHGTIEVTVEGNTDNIGSDAYNQKLSVRRATAVRDYLAKHGIAESRMTVVGKGASNPVASNDTEDGRAQNRRVELLVAQ